MTTRLAVHRPAQARGAQAALRRAALLLALGLALGLGLLPPAQAARLALVIGNKDYAIGALANPVNDAQAMAQALAALGFQVSLVTNLKRDDIGRTVEGFATGIRPGDDVLVFYAGHGVQVKGINYLPAVDARINVESDVPLNSLNLNELLQRLDEAKAGVRLLLVDACRDNPYSRSFRSATRGLARVEDAPSGTLMHFATRPGGVAADGSGGHGLYTTELLKHLRTPGVPVESMLKRVGSAVRQASGGSQQPWTEGALDGEFYFAAGTALPEPPGVAGTSSAAPAPAPAGPGTAVAGAPAAPTAARSAARPPAVVSDCAECPGLVLVPAGSFRMGASDGAADEQPPRSVQLPAFLMGQTEVTQGQWKAVMGSNPSRFSECGDQCPVESVCWNDAQAFVRKLSAQTGQHYRLPSEAEWEYAARAGSASTYAWGSTASHEHANYGQDTCCEGRVSGRDRWEHTAPVAQFAPNAFGLHDMHGNVSEWVQDVYRASYRGLPLDGSPWLSSDKDAPRVIRGGGWDGTPADLRVSARDWGTPGYCSTGTGLRVARRP